MIYMNAAEGTMPCQEMKFVEGNKIYERDSCGDLIQSSCLTLNDQE